MSYYCLNLVLGKYVERFRLTNNHELSVFRDKEHLRNCIEQWKREIDGYWLFANIHENFEFEDFELIPISSQEDSTNG